MHELPPLAARQCGVFSAVQAVAEGWSRSALRWAARCGQLLPLRPGVYQTTDLAHLSPFERTRWIHAGPAIAAVIATPGAAASHSTAAVLHGLPLAFVPDRPCVTVVPDHTGEIVRTHIHRAAGEMFSLPVGSISCTTVERSVVDLAREHGVAAGVVALDYALRKRLTTEDRVQNTLVYCHRWPGVIAARVAAASADPRSESPLESLSRLKFVGSVIPAPDLQAVIGDARGAHAGRVDFYWDRYGVVGECDGALKYDAAESATTLLEEKRRQERLEELGLIVVRWGWPDLRDFDQVVIRLQRAFRRGQARPAADRRWTLPHRL